MVSYPLLMETLARANFKKNIIGGDLRKHLPKSKVDIDCGKKKSMVE